MKWNEPLTLKIQILSPVAIGTGEKCNTLSFVADGNKKVLVIDEHQFIATLNDRQRALFLRWLEPLVEKLAHLREQMQKARGNQQLQKRLQNERQETESQLSLEKFLQQILRVPQPAQWLRQGKGVRYEVTAISLPSRYEGFSLCLKAPDNRPYIPGSELKGAIRTAVLNFLLQHNPVLLSNLQEQLQSLGSDRGQLRKQLRNLWQTAEHNLIRAGESDSHHDLFRGIAISDSEPLPTEALRIYGAKRLGMSRDVKVFVEAIAPRNETSATLSIARPDRWLEHMGLVDKGGWLNWQKLAEALYEHANEVLDFIAHKFPQMHHHVQGLKNQNSKDAPLLCLGWGQGFVSVTMTTPLRKAHPNAYEALRQAMAQAFGQYGRTKPNNFPKTIWVALDANNNPAYLFGWVKLVPVR
ncbi:MAG: type III-A CRISPR-associated RAMP protein Csm5 [Armatimonadota bacterium]